MKRPTSWLALAALAASGCIETTPTAPAPAVPAPAPSAGATSGGAAASTDPAAPKGTEGAAAVVLTDDQVAAINKLPDPVDREKALAQKVCPVASEADPKGGQLGDMGTPVKVEHDGKVVFLCCKGCKEDFDKDPAKYIARAEASSQANQASQAK